MKEFRPPEEPALCADSSAGVPLVYSLTFSWSNRSIEMGFLAYITVIPATPPSRLVFRLRTRHIESPSGLRGIVYLIAGAVARVARAALLGGAVRHLRVALNLKKKLACNINFTTPILELKNYMQH